MRVAIMAAVTTALGALALLLLAGCAQAGPYGSPDADAIMRAFTARATYPTAVQNYEYYFEDSVAAVAPKRCRDLAMLGIGPVRASERDDPHDYIRQNNWDIAGADYVGVRVFASPALAKSFMADLTATVASCPSWAGVSGVTHSEGPPETGVTHGWRTLAFSHDDSPTAAAGAAPASAALIAAKGNLLVFAVVPGDGDLAAVVGTAASSIER
ncbi:MAG: hypothetical protein JWO10_1848 [Microbacteriaceae bacterium]|nr:hypothetical protein [Microbacteriaceae bacterium]